MAECVALRLSTPSSADCGVTAVMQALDAALALHDRNPADPAARETVEKTVPMLARHVLSLRKHDSANPLVDYALGLIRQLSGRALFPAVVNGTDLAITGDGEAKSWPELIATMLLAPPRGWSAVPRFATVPRWLWGVYAEWLFAEPGASDSAPSAEALARCTLNVEELASWAERNMGSAAVRAAVETYARHASMLPFAAGSSRTLRRLADARARILTRLVVGTTDRFDAITWDRRGRKLRIGVLCRTLAAAGETYGTLARIEHLDPARFDVTVFALEVPDSPIAAHLRRRAAIVPLGGEVQAQVTALRDSSLDALLLAGSVAGPLDDFSKLALYRCAPLQVLLDSSQVPAGLATIDLRLGGDGTVGDGERTAVVYPHVYDFSAPPATELPVFDRASLGLPARATVLVTIIRPAECTPCGAETLARILAGSPETWLLAYLAPGFAGTNRALRFEQLLRNALQSCGVEADRGAFFAATDRTYAEARALLEVADLYLDPPASVGSGWIAEAIWAGKPVVAGGSGADATTSGAAFARRAGIAGIAGSLEAYVARAVELATAVDLRDAAAAAARECVAAARPCFDSLGASDELGFVLETAFDRLHADGHEAFRALDRPGGVLAAGAGEERLAAANDLLIRGEFAAAAELAEANLRWAPRDPEARALYGRVLDAQGQHRRAVDYLLAAVQQRGDRAQTWLELAGALQRGGRMSDAMKALESALRLDSGLAAGWVMMIDVAERCGATDLMREAWSALKAIAPDHPRAADTTDDEPVAASANLAESLPHA